MSGQHTQGRLHVCNFDESKLRGITGGWVAATQSDQEVEIAAERAAANARRLAACWNACEGASTEELEGLAALGMPVTKVVDGIKQERDRLRAELDAARVLLRQCLTDEFGVTSKALISDIEAAIKPAGAA